MFGWPIPFSIDARINRAYARSLTRHGPTPQGVFWNSTKTQKARFAALTAAIRADHEKQIGRQQMERQQNGTEGAKTEGGKTEGGNTHQRRR